MSKEYNIKATENSELSNDNFREIRMITIKRKNFDMKGCKDTQTIQDNHQNESENLKPKVNKSKLIQKFHRNFVKACGEKINKLKLSQKLNISKDY